MSDDAEQLPLREGALRWCAPHLVQAVHAAEAYRPSQGQTDQAAPWDPYGEPPLPAPVPSRRMTAPEAWVLLTADLRSRIEQGELVVTGVQIRPIAETMPRPIPRFWAGAIEFDFERGGIIVEDRRYLHVRLSRGQTGASTALSLREALILWSDTALVEAVQRAETPFAAGELDVSGRAHLGGARFTGVRPHFVSSRWMDSEFSALRKAWKALVPDFQRRLEAEEFFLVGVLTFPTRHLDRSPIPGVWAADYEFDFHAGTLSGAARHYVAVRASRQRPAEVDAPMAETIDKPDPTIEVGDVIIVPARPRGRPSLPMPELVEIARSRLSHRLSNNKAETAVLLAEFQRLHPNRKLPGQRSVSDHVESIYVAAAALALSQNTQK